MSPTDSPERYVDLHLHTTWSDGRWEPRRVVAEAAQRGLATIAITDHDVLGGLPEAELTANAADVELLLGVELTADWDGRTVHVLGYGIEPTAERLVAALEHGRALMGDHVDRVMSAVEAAGERLGAEQLGKYRARYVGGASLVLAMVETGVLRRAKNGGELLRLASREPRAYTAAEAIDLIHDAGGVAALAHPARITRVGQNRDSDAGESGSLPHGRGSDGRSALHGPLEIRPLVDAGLDAIEVWNIVHGEREREHYRGVARDMDLLVTGGSDCHGPRKTLGPRIGSQMVPYSVLDGLKRGIERRRGRVGETR